MLSTLMLAHNLETIKYPFIAAIKSVLPVSDEVLIVDCENTDSTIDQIKAIDSPKIKILPGRWGTHYTVQSEMINMAVEAATSPWIFQIDADEVLAEWSYGEMKYITMLEGYVAARTHYIHFTPDFHTTWPFIYENRIRMIRKDSRYRAVGDACDFSDPRPDNTLVYMSQGVQIFHYGKTHTGRRKEALVKEWTFQQLYKDLGFPDPKVTASLDKYELDYNVIFSHDKEKGLFTPFTGKHPAAVLEYIAEMEAADVAFLNAKS